MKVTVWRCMAAVAVDTQKVLAVGDIYEARHAAQVYGVERGREAEIIEVEIRRRG